MFCLELLNTNSEEKNCSCFYNDCFNLIYKKPLIMIYQFETSSDSHGHRSVIYIINNKDIVRINREI